MSDIDDVEPKMSMEVDDFIDFRLSPQRFICGRHIKELNTLPHDFNFSYQNEKNSYPDSSDNDSDSDDDKNCCMFGVGKSQMIVLKFREVSDLFNELNFAANSEVVCFFFCTQYFISGLCYQNILG